MTYTATDADWRLVNTGILTDFVMARARTSTSVAGLVVGDRLRGDEYLLTGSTAAGVLDVDAFMTPTNGYGNAFSAMNGFGCGNDLAASLNWSTLTQVANAFRRAPGFFDVVCDTGTGATHTVAHGLTVVPELMIRKSRSGTGSWGVYSQTLGNGNFLELGSTNASASTTIWDSTSPTSSVFTIATNFAFANASGTTYVTYLFATKAGISKVGSYTGNGGTQTINMGFSSGCRFFLCKRTDSTGDWFIWSSATGISSGNDPHLSLNSTAAEVTTDDSVDVDASGIIVNQLAANINVLNGSYIYLGIS